MYLYKHLGLSWESLGIIFTIMLLPFVIFNILIGKLIDIYHVRKRLLITIGIFTIGIFTIIMSLINTQNIFYWAFILFMTRVGAVMIETTSEIYFFTHVREEDAYLLSIFRDMSPMAYILAPLLASLFIIFFPFKYLFMALGIFTLVGLYYVIHLKHNHNEIGIPDSNK
jgi:MFS family permease